MYKQINTTEKIEMSTGGFMTPIVTLEDESSGQLVQIINDDHCYVCCLQNRYNKYVYMTHIFKELFDILVKLPTPN